MFTNTNITGGIALLAGIMTFFSPCVFPLIPSYLSYITGMNYDELVSGKRESMWKLFLHSIFFVLGFSLVFVLLGTGFTLAGYHLRNYQKIITRIGGILIILFGLFILGIIKFPSLQKERRLYIKNKPSGYLGSFLVGIIFSAGWTPCIGPVLGSILTLSTTSDNFLKGVLLLAAYSLGLGIPFILSSLFLNILLSFLKKISWVMPAVVYITGIFLIIVGILLFFDKFSILQKI